MRSSRGSGQRSSRGNGTAERERMGGLAEHGSRLAGDCHWPGRWWCCYSVRFQKNGNGKDEGDELPNLISFDLDKSDKWGPKLIYINIFIIKKNYVAPHSSGDQTPHSPSCGSASGSSPSSWTDCAYI